VHLPVEFPLETATCKCTNRKIANPHIFRSFPITKMRDGGKGSAVAGDPF
jgi:hypothetical protein